MKEAVKGPESEDSWVKRKSIYFQYNGSIWKSAIIFLIKMHFL